MNNIKEIISLESDVNFPNFTCKLCIAIVDEDEIAQVSKTCEFWNMWTWPKISSVMRFYLKCLKLHIYDE